jgi:hypothetical protein
MRSSLVSLEASWRGLPLEVVCGGCLCLTWHRQLVFFFFLFFFFSLLHVNSLSFFPSLNSFIFPYFPITIPWVLMPQKTKKTRIIFCKTKIEANDFLFPLRNAQWAHWNKLSKSILKKKIWKDQIKKYISREKITKKKKIFNNECCYSRCNSKLDRRFSFLINN